MTIRQPVQVCQWQSFHLIVCAQEILAKANLAASGLLLDIEAGDEMAVIAADVDWLHIGHNVEKLVMICLNLVVRDRLEDDFYPVLGQMAGNPKHHLQDQLEQ